MFLMTQYVPTGVAAREIGVSTATLTRWVAAGDVTPAQRTVGNHYRWDLTSLRAQVRRLHTGGHDVTAEDIARVVHAAQRELQIIQGDPVPSPPWDDAPDYQVRQAIAGVQEVLRNPQLTAEESQKLWQDRMRADGWTYSQEKNHARKTHPNLVPWDALPAEQKLKDQLFVAIIRALAPTMQHS
jgi:DNA-binding transcriptional MerR regulator